MSAVLAERPTEVVERSARAVELVEAARTVRNIAHRGASSLAPENTLTAVAAAIALGADMVEVDVHRTKDGALVVLHDTTLTRTTDAATVLPQLRPWRVADLTLDQVRMLDAGAWKSPEFVGEQVPTLAEVLDLLRGTGTGLLLELKQSRRYPGVAADLAADLCRVRDCDVVVQSFDHDAMLAFKQRAPHVPVGLLGATPRRRLAQVATWADQVNPRHRGLTARYVDAVHDAGITCHPWTVDRAADMERLVGAGVDGIITNRPDVLRGVLAQGMSADRLRDNRSPVR